MLCRKKSQICMKIDILAEHVLVNRKKSKRNITKAYVKYYHIYHNMLKFRSFERNVHYKPKMAFYYVCKNMQNGSQELVKYSDSHFL